MTPSSKNSRAFYVVHFIELPFDGIDDYVCVPYTWLVDLVRTATDLRAVVVYPKDEDPFDTRDRVRRKESYNVKWRSYMAAVIHESDTYRDAENWIATKNGYGNLDGMEPRCLKREQSINIQDNQSVECAQTEEIAADSNGQSSSSQCIHENLQESLMQEQPELSMPHMDMDKPTVVIDRNRPTAAQNSTSTNHQTHPRVVLEQQMLENFATLFTQMGSTLRYTSDMYNNLRSSIFETAEIYRSLLDAVERFNTVGNSASNASPLSNVTPEVPQATEERHTEVTARASTSNENQHSHNVDNKAPKNKHNLGRFILPKDYDSDDTRWTLKYQKSLPGLIELIPQSGIYVSYKELQYCERVSIDCKSLARRLLPEVFDRKALSVCLSMSEKAQRSNRVDFHLNPGLDENASTVLLNYVLEHGLQRGWNTDLQPILSTLHSKIEEMRLK